ncbi:MAG: hypothetical protein WBG37_00135 [Desulfobacterales bacterium]|jgi:hypothetical protein
MASQPTLRVHVNIDLPEAALQTIVSRCKAHTAPDEKGHYRVDTADKVSELVSKYLQETAFLQFVDDPRHYET